MTNRSIAALLLVFLSMPTFSQEHHFPFKKVPQFYSKVYDVVNGYLTDSLPTRCAKNSKSFANFEVFICEGNDDSMDLYMHYFVQEFYVKNDSLLKGCGHPSEIMLSLVLRDNSYYITKCIKKPYSGGDENGKLPRKLFAKWNCASDTTNAINSQMFKNNVTRQAELFFNKQYLGKY
jgi:hypothetical protein